VKKPDVRNGFMVYLRPETAQGFCKLLKCAKSGRMKVPLE
jgi:glycyl-tRNA synthetase (class II)